MKWRCGPHAFDLDERPLIMGVLNVTPDSFSVGYPSLAEALTAAEKLVRDGADIVDVGGESTRPGSDSVDTRTELERVIPVIETLRQRYDIPISIDTQKVEVAREALAAGASIVNGVSASLDIDALAPLIGERDVGFVAMHMLERPRIMQRNPNYGDVVEDVSTALLKVVSQLADLGVSSERVLFDPGIGFGKRLEHNLSLMNNCDRLARRLGRPLLIGISRKSWLTHLLAVPRDAIEELDAYTMVASTRLPFPSVAVHRVHNVRLLKRALHLAAALDPPSP